jgi:hypothetical protein
MALIRREMNEGMAAASRQNGAKSRGPATVRGRSITRFNAAKHWGRAEVMRTLLPALGEHEEEFESFRRGLYDSLQPEDAFEAILIDDMADIHWRLRRMLRGEAALLAKQRREAMARLDEQEAAQQSGRLRTVEPSVAEIAGLVGLDDSAPKFIRILEWLNLIGRELQQQGATPEGQLLLKKIYGPNPGSRGGNLLTLYQKAVKLGEKRDSESAQQYEAALHSLLQQEIAWFKECQARERLARDELRAPRIEAAMLEGEFDPIKWIFYQEGMERRFERKWRLLMKHRARRRRAARELLEAEAVGLRSFPVTSEHRGELPTSAEPPEAASTAESPTAGKS